MSETDDSPVSGPLAAVLVLVPVVGGVLLFVLFERGPVHRLGLYLLVAGGVVGLGLLLLRVS